MNIPKTTDALKDIAARLEGLREYLKSEGQIDLTLAVIEAEHKVLDVRALLLKQWSGIEP